MSEIPGFYYDPEKKKYFRLEQGTPKHIPITNEMITVKQAFQQAEKWNQNSIKKLFLPNSIINHQIDMKSKSIMKEDVIKIQLNNANSMNKHTIKIDGFQTRNVDHVKCKYLVGSPETDRLYVVANNNLGLLVYQVDVKDTLDKFDFDVNSSFQIFADNIHKNRKLFDFEYINNTFIMLYGDEDSENKEYSKLYISSYDRDSLLQLDNRLSNIYHSATWFSSNHIAVGGENKILIFNHPLLAEYETIKTKSTINTLKFINSNLIIAGDNKGFISCYDVRDKNNVLNKQIIKNSSLTYSQVLSDETRLIISGHNNFMKQFDLRFVNVPSASYSDYVNTCNKIPFSFDESMGLLCSSGSDSVIKYWSMDNGKLLHQKMLLKEFDGLTSIPSVYCWYSHSWKFLNNNKKPVTFCCYQNKFSYFFNEEIE